MSTTRLSPISPLEWINTAKEKAPRSQGGSDWFSGNTHPEKAGWYERYFTDGLYKHWWDGSQWWAKKYSAKAALKEPIKPHWRQVGDYPCWRQV